MLAWPPSKWRSLTWMREVITAYSTFSFITTRIYKNRLLLNSIVDIIFLFKDGFIL